MNTKPKAKSTAVALKKFKGFLVVPLHIHATDAKAARALARLASSVVQFSKFGPEGSVETGRNKVHSVFLVRKVKASKNFKNGYSL